MGLLSWMYGSRTYVILRLFKLSEVFHTFESHSLKSCLLPDLLKLFRLVSNYTSSLSEYLLSQYSFFVHNCTEFVDEWTQQKFR